MVRPGLELPSASATERPRPDSPGKVNSPPASPACDRHNDRHQRYLARGPFSEGYAGLYLGIVGEAAPFVHDRRAIAPTQLTVAWSLPLRGRLRGAVPHRQLGITSGRPIYIGSTSMFVAQLLPSYGLNEHRPGGAIAVLKAAGERPAQVMLMVAAAAAVLGLAGSALGVPACVPRTTSR